MANVQLTVDKTRYTLSCADGQEKNLMQLAKILNDRVAQVRSTGYVPENLALVMAGLLLANEVQEAENQKINEKSDEKEQQPLPAVSEEVLEASTQEMEKIIERISALAQRMENA